jgi:hypothetical protein
VIGAGSALLITGIAYDVIAVRPARVRAAEAETPLGYRVLLDDYTSRRTTAIALCASGALTIGIGFVLRKTVFAPSVTANVGSNSAMLAIGWER